MQQYKFYFLDDRGHVFRAQDHLLPDDLSALENAQALCIQHVIELWQSARQVARVEPDGAQAASGQRRSM
jgi:hypothetical protein